MVRGRDQGHLGAAIGGRRGEGEPHLAARIIADEPHRVDRLPRAACGDHHAATRQVVAGTNAVHHRVEDRRRAGQPPGALVSAREVTRLRLDDGDPAVAQFREIFLQRGLGPHRVVHRGRDDHRASSCEQGRRHDVIRPAIRDAADDVGGRGCDQDELRPIAQEDMRLRSSVGGPYPGCHGFAGDALKGRRTDETHRRRGHRNADLAPCLAQRRGEVDHLVCGDPAGDQQRDAQAPELNWNRSGVEGHGG